MAKVLELTAEIVAAQASTSQMSTEELIASIHKVYNTLKQLDAGLPIAAAESIEKKPTISPKQSVKKNEVICLVCGRGGMKTLSRHIQVEHGFKPAAYKKQFGLPASTKLVAMDYSAKRKEVAAKTNLAANLEKARATRAANLKNKSKKRGD